METSTEANMRNHPPRRWRQSQPLYPHQHGPEYTAEDISKMSSSFNSEKTSAGTQLPLTIKAGRDAESPASGRTIIICLDGTGDKFDNDNSNVVNFVACLKKDTPSQLTYYQSGIGTYDGSGLSNGISASMDMAVGSGLGVHIKDAYSFLMQNYQEGDKICLLGFSRGAYTVRCLAGMLHKVGLLPAHNTAQVSFAYNFYKDDTEAGWDMSADFKKTFCTNVEVYFVGVWDCVASVGFIPRKLPFSKTPTNTINYFRHAMALDEHRAKFKICQFAQKDPAAKSRAATLVDTPKQAKDGIAVRAGRSLKGCFGSKKVDPEKEIYKTKHENSSSTSQLRDHKQNEFMKRFEQMDHDAHGHIDTDVREVWFAGAHADVGGGAVGNGERHMLSRIPLRWMIRQTFECNTGIIFNTAALAETGLDLHTMWPVYQETTRPIAGPSPTQVELYESKTLPPLRRRSTALGVDGKSRKESNASIEPHDDKLMTNGVATVDTEKAQPNSRINGTTRRDTTTSLRGDIYDPLTHSTHTHSNPIHCPHHPDLLPEQVEDHFDAMAPINDMLVMAKGWWILEFWPVKVRVQNKNDETWVKKVRFNKGRFRAIREVEPEMHWTVRCRAEEKGYRVRNRCDREAVWRVVS